MSLLLYENLPLRTTRGLGDFAEDAPLAHVYGDLTAARFPLRRMTSTRGHAADHPMEITGAGSGLMRTDSWAAAIEDDGSGHVCTFVDYGAPVPDGDPMWAFGRGKRDPATNALLANPGDVLADISRLAGRNDNFQTLREEAARADLRLAGRVDEIKSIRAWLDVPAQAAGAIWCPGMSRRYPAPVSGYVLELDKMAAGDVRVSAAIDDTADILRIAYDWCDASAKPLRSLELKANPMRYGGVVKELELRWLRTPANAVTVGTPILQRLACERYNVAFDSSRIDIRPGQWLKLAAHPEWPFSGADPVIMTLAVTVNHAAGTVEVSGETMRTTPAVTVSAHSAAFNDLSGASLEVSEVNGVATFTVREENERALAGARVSLDGGAPKTTDAKGQVSFPVTPGLHRVDIAASGFLPQTLTVTL